MTTHLPFWHRPEWTDRYAGSLEAEAIKSRRVADDLALNRDHWKEVIALFSELPDLPEPLAGVVHEAVVGVGSQADAARFGATELVPALLKALLPWRKGPFSFLGSHVDAEWCSDQKWDRIEKYLDPLKDKKILDIGCNNGYYMARALAQNPELVVGIDPSERCKYQFELLQYFLRDPRLVYEMQGVEDIGLYPSFFDVILCMGVIYHQRNPMNMLQQVLNTLRPGGQAIVESIAIPGDQSISLSPPDRYAKMHNVYFIPTAACLEVWMKRAGFREIKLVSITQMLPEEQRRTELAPYWSLEDYLDPDDRSKTVEGYDAPLRVAISGRRSLK
jgi:tRNA (mo5U34)-methyltransferase